MRNVDIDSSYLEPKIIYAIYYVILLRQILRMYFWYIICTCNITKISLMYSLLNIGRLYLVLGFISILVYLNIPEEMNQSTMAVWILGLSSIYFILGIRRLIRHYKENK